MYHFISGDERLWLFAVFYPFGVLRKYFSNCYPAYALFWHLIMKASYVGYSMFLSEIFTFNMSHQYYILQGFFPKIFIQRPNYSHIPPTVLSPSFSRSRSLLTKAFISSSVRKYFPYKEWYYIAVQNCFLFLIFWKACSAIHICIRISASRFPRLLKYFPDILSSHLLILNVSNS